MSDAKTKAEPVKEFWLTHPDPTQAAVHLALQWLAYVYPASELQIDRTLSHALPYADSDLSSRWAQFLDENDVEEHVQALEWMAQTLSSEQIPFLIETCWRLLLVDHELPTHVPLAIRILGRVVNISEGRVHELGQNVFREYTEGQNERKRAPLLPVDPRYLDRVEWRLYGHSPKPTHRLSNSSASGRWSNLSLGFGVGTLFGAVLVVALVFGPLQLGRVRVPIMTHELTSTPADTAPTETAVAPKETAPVSEPLVTPAPEVAVAPVTTAEPVAAPEVAEPVAPVIAADPAPIAVEIPEPTPVERAPAQPAPVASERVLMTVTASILNVRAQPTVNAEVVIKLAQGARVWAYPGEADGLWMKVRVEGVDGYASARFLEEPVN